MEIANLPQFHSFVDICGLGWTLSLPFASSIVDLLLFLAHQAFSVLLLKCCYSLGFLELLVPVSSKAWPSRLLLACQPVCFGGRVQHYPAGHESLVLCLAALLVDDLLDISHL